MRRTATIWLNFTTTAPLSHGRGVEGNMQVMRKDLAFRKDPETGEVVDFEYPLVSGAALRAVLREAAVRHAFHVLGVPEGSVSKDALRLLLKGGKNDKGGVTVPLDERRRLENLFPLLRMFGYMDGGGMQGTGILSVSDVKPVSPETIAAGLIDVTASPCTLAVNGEEKVTGPSLDLLKNARVIPLYAYAGHVRGYFKHDMRTSDTSRMLSDGDRKALDDASSSVSEKKQVALKKAGPMPTTLERREANESMPHAGEVIPAGVSLQAKIVISCANDLDLGVFVSALRWWIQEGAFLGGMRAKGHGSLRVEAMGFTTMSTPVGETPLLTAGEVVGYVVDEDVPKSTYEAKYTDHIVAQREAAIEYLGTVQRGA